MPRFINHDAIADGYFNTSYTGGTAAFTPWKTALTNSKQSLMLMLVRMEKDYAAMAPKMRRAWGSKEIEPQLLLFICFV